MSTMKTGNPGGLRLVSTDPAALESLWSAYVSALTKAERSRAMADGISAAHAWQRWLCAFSEETGALVSRSALNLEQMGAAE